MTRQTKVISAALLVGALVPGLAGCWGGPAASTQVQATQNTGNGTQAFVGDIRVENATLVLGPEGSSSATLTMSIVAPGEGDRLLAVEIGGSAAYVTGGTVDIGRGQFVQFGYNSQSYVNSYAFDAKISTYVPVRLVFERNGIADISVLTVPPTGFYAGIAPQPATAPAA